LQFDLSFLFKGILPTSQSFHGWRTSTLYITPVSSEWRNTMVLLRKSSMLEGRGSSSLLSIVNWVCCVREYCLPLSVFKSEKHHLCSKIPLQLNRRGTVAWVRESIMFEARAASTLFSSLNWVCCLN
jgi:hypothetical protein